MANGNTVDRRTILRGTAGVIAGGTAGFVAARYGRESAFAQDASPVATDISAYPEVVYTGKEYAFEGPVEIAGGLTRVTLQNDGAMDHHAMFFRFNDDKSMADLPAAAAQGLGGLFAIGASHGGPGSVGGGEQSTVIMDLTEGNYVILCVIPDDDGIPHAMKGMLLPLTVTAPAATPAEPTAGGTIELVDFHFMGLPEQVPAGQQNLECRQLRSAAPRVRNRPAGTGRHIRANRVHADGPTGGISRRRDGRHRDGGNGDGGDSGRRDGRAVYRDCRGGADQSGNEQLGRRRSHGGRLLRNLLHTRSRDGRSPLRARHDPGAYGLLAFAPTNGMR